MAVTVICPNLRCRSALQVPDNMRGRIVRCGRCGKNFSVPAIAPEQPASTPAEDEAEAPAEKSTRK